MQSYKRMLTIVWTHQITNQRVPKKIGEKKKLYMTKTRKQEFIGHLRNNQQYKILQFILQRKIKGKKTNIFN